MLNRHAGYVFVHRVLARYLIAFGHSVDFLILCKTLEDVGFCRASMPKDGEIILPRGKLTEAVVLQYVPNQLDVAVKHDVVVSSVHWVRRGHVHRVNIRPEDQIFAFRDKSS